MAEPRAETPHDPGTVYKYIVASESTPDNDTCDTVMLVNGYFIMVNVFYADFSELTFEDERNRPVDRGYVCARCKQCQTPKLRRKHFFIHFACITGRLCGTMPFVK